MGHGTREACEIIFQKGNQATIQFSKTQKNLTLRLLNRTHRVNVSWLCEVFKNLKEVGLNRYCKADEMAAISLPRLSLTLLNGMRPWSWSVLYMRSRLWLKSAASDTMSGGRPKPPPPIVGRPSIVDTGEKGVEEQLAILCEFMMREFLNNSPDEISTAFDAYGNNARDLYV